MKLNNFLKENSFKKYEKTIDLIRDKFIDMDCEKFLWPNYNAKERHRKKTQILIKNDGEYKINNTVNEFMNQFDWIDWRKEIAFIYPENYSKTFLIISEITSRAKKKIIVKNLFDLDETINHLAVFDINNIDDIKIMFYLVYSLSAMGDNFGGYKLFGKGLMYYSGCLYFNGTVLEPSSPNLLAHFQGNVTRRDINPFLILESREAIELVIRHGYFKNELDIFRNLYEFILPKFHKWYENARDIASTSSCDWKNRKESVFSKLVSDGIAQSKWKSEESLFKLVKSKYPKAAYQHRPLWLSPQSLDIFIPELNIGIEYQGIQHYQSVDYFGGKEGFERRIWLDNEKRRKCSENGIKLIEWNYQETINLINLKNKLA